MGKAVDFFNRELANAKQEFGFAWRMLTVPEGWVCVSINKRWPFIGVQWKTNSNYWRQLVGRS